jgi:hypothetical protein
MRTMKSALFAICALLCVSGIAGAAPVVNPNTDTDKLERDFMEATALLYAQDEYGTLKMACTATAYEHTGLVYRFITASHCVSDDNTDRERVEVEELNWYLTFDELGKISFFPAKVIGAGYQSRGDDFAILETTLESPVPTMVFAANNPSLGEKFVNVASPLGLGKQLLRGAISMSMLSRPVVVPKDNINWKNATILQSNSGPGSSGSAIISIRQKGIIAILVGSISGRGSPIIIALPVGRLKDFLKAIKAGTYQWYKPEMSSLNGNRRTKKGKGAIQPMESIPDTLEMRPSDFATATKLPAGDNE